MKYVVVSIFEIISGEQKQKANLRKTYQISWIISRISTHISSSLKKSLSPASV
jgi:hypothetical protein